MTYRIAPEIDPDWSDRLGSHDLARCPDLFPEVGAFFLLPNELKAKLSAKKLTPEVTLRSIFLEGVMDTEARLDRLERQMRFYKRLTVVLALVIVAGVSMGQAGDYKEITCRGLTVVNEKGDRVAALKSWKLGGVSSCPEVF